MADDWKRILISVIAGAVLGLFCIAGVAMRVGYQGKWFFLIATWYNRIIIGLIVGLAGGIEILDSKYNTYLRGLIIGTVVSGGLFMSTGFRDPVSFASGIVYGIVIDALATNIDKLKEKDEE